MLLLLAVVPLLRAAYVTALVMTPPGAAVPAKVHEAVDWLTARLATKGPLALPGLLGEDAKRDEGFLERNAALAMKAMELVNKSGEVSQELFLREVLPFRHFDEPVDEWRPVFYEQLRSLVEGKESLREAAEAVIPAVFSGALGKEIKFKGNSTPQVMAPLSETVEHGYASCTGIAILVADALRAVGVPARVVGTAEWNLPQGGNHNWVEVWWGGAWHFVDGAPTSAVEWDRTWFLDNAALAEPGGIHGIFTPVVVREEADAEYPVTWRDPAFGIPAVDRTLFYKNFGAHEKVGADGEEDPEWHKYREASER